jgi:hypothetical protein
MGRGNFRCPGRRRARNSPRCSDRRGGVALRADPPRPFGGSATQTWSAPSADRSSTRSTPTAHSGPGSRHTGSCRPMVAAPSRGIPSGTVPPPALADACRYPKSGRAIFLMDLDGAKGDTSMPCCPRCTTHDGPTPETALRKPPRRARSRGRLPERSPRGPGRSSQVLARYRLCAINLVTKPLRHDNRT